MATLQPNTDFVKSVMKGESFSTLMISRRFLILQPNWDNCLSDFEASTMNPPPVEHVAITVTAPADKEAPTPTPRAPKNPKSMVKKGVLALIIAPSVALIPITAGVLMCTPGFVIGHAILRYAVSCSFGDAYRTTSLDSTLTLGAVGGMFVGIFVAIVGGAIMIACLSIFHKIRSGNAMGWHRTSAEIAAQPSTKLMKLHTWVNKISHPIYFAYSLDTVARDIVKVHYPDLEMLDYRHVLAACMCGQYLITLATLLIRRLTRTKSKIALPTSEAEPLEGAGSSAEIADANVEDAIQDASEKV